MLGTTGGRVRLAVVATACLLGLALGSGTPESAAFELRGGDAVNVPAGTTVTDDLLVAAQTLTIAGDVDGDVFALASTIIVSGTIRGDLIALAQQLTVDGTVRGDVRAAAQQIALNGTVGGSGTVAGQQVIVGRQGAVGGGLLGAGRELNMVGRVGRGMLVAADALYLGGTIGGDVEAQVERLSVDPTARVGGQLRYTSANPATVPTGVAARGVEYSPVQRREERAAETDPWGGLLGFWNVIWLAGTLLAGLLLVRFLPGFAEGAVAQLWRRPLASFGLGLALLLLGPLAILLLAVTLIGLPLALLALAGYLVALYVGQLVLGLAVGSALLAPLRWRRAATVGPWLGVLVVVGLLVLYVLTHLPWIGGVATVVALCLGSGALLLQVGAARRPAAA